MRFVFFYYFSKSLCKANVKFVLQFKQKTVELNRKIQEYTESVGVVGDWDDLSAQEADETVRELYKYKVKFKINVAKRCKYSCRNR